MRSACLRLIELHCFNMPLHAALQGACPHGGKRSLLSLPSVCLLGLLQHPIPHAHHPPDGKRRQPEQQPVLW